MSSPVPPQPRGIDYNLPTCGETRCNSHGRCENSPDGGIELVCECDLGYQGSSCEDTVNGALSLPLTLSVLAVIIGLLILAFIVAKVRQKQKKRNRYWNILFGLPPLKAFPWVVLEKTVIFFHSRVRWEEWHCPCMFILTEQESGCRYHSLA